MKEVFSIRYDRITQNSGQVAVWVDGKLGNTELFSTRLLEVLK